MSLSSILLGKAAVERRQWQLLDLMHCGISGGILAGISFAVAQAAMSGAQGRPVLEPLQLAGSLIVEPMGIVPGSISLATIGLFVHFVISSVYGIVFLFLHWELKRHNESTERLILDGAIFGLMIWMVHFFWIAPRAYPQFLTLDLVWNGLVAHAFFFGGVLGYYVANLRFAREEEEEDPGMPEWSRV
ncbi:MAG TPA: hypothetical protein VFR10_04285 [bacterium]|nr:hypothetical protein [bacterium]